MNKTTVASLECTVAAQAALITNLVMRLEKLENRAKHQAVAYLKSKNVSSVDKKPWTPSPEQQQQHAAYRAKCEAARTAAIAGGKTVTLN